MQLSRFRLGALGALGLFACQGGIGAGCNKQRNLPVGDPPIAPVRDGGVPGDGGVTASVPMIPSAPGPLELEMPPGSLDRLFGGLARASEAELDGRVDVVFLGDSHTAGDALTGRVRRVWQDRFGDAGRGLVAAGKPAMKHYYQRDVHYGSSGRWTSSVAGHKGDPEPYGLATVRVSSDRKDAVAWVETCADCPSGHKASHVEIWYWASPDGGLMRYRVDADRWQTQATATRPGEAAHAASVKLDVPDGPHRVEVSPAGKGRIELFGIVSERRTAGVVVDSLGVVGRRLANLLAWDWTVIGPQLADRDPRLVVVQFGTNEADDPDTDLAALGRHYDEITTRLRTYVPHASILLLGPPDLGKRQGDKRLCGDRSAIPGPDDPPPIAECEWHTPSQLLDIVEVERAAAARNGVAFFDTLSAMGGPEWMHTFVTSDPRLAYGDHVHFTSAGYDRWADALMSSIEAELVRWQKRQPAAGPGAAAPALKLPEP